MNQLLDQLVHWQNQVKQSELLLADCRASRDSLVRLCVLEGYSYSQIMLVSGIAKSTIQLIVSRSGHAEER